MESSVDLGTLDLGYLAQFVGMRWNELLLARLHAHGHDDLRHAHGYVFQHLVDGPRTIGALAERLGVSQQAASKSVAELISLSYLTSSPGRDRRAREVALSARGRQALALARRFRAATERRLQKKHGTSIARAKAVLAEVLADLGGIEAVQARRIREPG